MTEIVPEQSANNNSFGASPDGRGIAFSDRTDPRNIWVQPIDGGAPQMRADVSALPLLHKRMKSCIAATGQFGTELPTPGLTVALNRTSGLTQTKR